MNSLADLRARPEIGLGGIGGTAVALFGAISWKVLARKSWREDFKMRRALPRYGGRTKQAALWFGHLGKDHAVLPAAAALSGKLWKDDRVPGAIAVALAAVSAAAAANIFDTALPKRYAPPGRRDPFDTSYPSGHALRSTTLLLTAAYVLSREKMVDEVTIGGLAVVLSAAVGVDRLIHDRHWTTDVIAGWVAAVALAAFTAAGYEIASRKRVAGGDAGKSPGDAPRIRSRKKNLAAR